MASTRHTVNQFDDSDDSSAPTHRDGREGCFYGRIRNQNLIMRVKRDVPWSQQRVTESRQCLILWVILCPCWGRIVGKRSVMFNNSEFRTLNNYIDVRPDPDYPKPDQLQCISCCNYTTLVNLRQTAEQSIRNKGIAPGCTRKRNCNSW